ATERVTVLNQTPSAFHQLVSADQRMRIRSALRLVIFGGEALSFRMLAPWIERHGDDMPRLVNMYGITEATVHASIRPIRADDVRNSGSESLIGEPLPGVSFHIMDRCSVPVPIGVPGELYIGGAALARGYLDRPRLTADRFRPDPTGAPGQRLYRTGDIVRQRADGDLAYVGRADRQVKLRGYRVEIGEVE